MVFPLMFWKARISRELLAHEALSSLDDLYVRIGEGGVPLKELMEDIKNILFGGVSPLVTPTGAFNKIELTTLDPVSVKLSSCCKPNPTAKDNCALLTPKGLSVHHKNCERFRKLKFQREDAVNISWKTRQTHVRKKQSPAYSAGDQEKCHGDNRFCTTGAGHGESGNSFQLFHLHPAWELVFRVVNLYDLQRVLKHFDKSALPYEFDLDC